MAYGIFIYPIRICPIHPFPFPSVQNSSKALRMNECPPHSEGSSLRIFPRQTEAIGHADSTVIH